MSVKSILKPFVGRSFLIPFYTKLHSLILHLLGYGTGASIKESGELNFIKRLPKIFSNKDCIILFDIGANSGEYSKALINSMPDKNYKLFSFEPSPRMFEKLKECLNPFLTTGKVVLVPFGLGVNNEDLYLNSNKENASIATIFERKLEHWGKEYETNFRELISLIRLDDFCNDNKVDHIHFLKMDIEGNEYNALLGAKEMISSRKIDIIQFEFGISNVDSKTYLKDFFLFFEKHGYSLYRIVHNNLVPVEIYKERLEVFLISNYIAVSPNVELRKS